MVKAHGAEINCVEWSHINQKSIVTGSNDMTVKVWDAATMAAGQPLCAFKHEFTVYQTIWHPTHDSILGSASGD